MTEEKVSIKVIGAMVATGILSFCGVLAETAMNVAFPTFINEFQVGISTVQWLTTIYLLVLSIVVPLSGFLKHSFKNKQLFLASVAIFIVGLVVAAVASVFPILLLGRAIQGLGTGIALPLMFNIIMEQVPPSKIGIMMGVGTMIPAIAPAIGPIFGGVVITNLGWRYLFILLLPILVIALFVGTRTIDQRSHVSKMSFDQLGLVAVTLLFVGLIFGFSSMGTHAFFSLNVAGAFLVALLGLGLLLLQNKRQEQPILKLNLMKNTSFTGHVLSFFIVQLVLMGLVFILPNYIQIVNGLDPQSSGLVIFPGAALGAFMTPLGGKIFDKFGPKKPILFGSGLLFVSLLIFLLLTGNLGKTLIGTLYMLFTLGVGFTFGNLMTNGLQQLEQSNQPDGNAIIMTFQQVAGAMGTSIIASILTLSQSRETLDYAQAIVQGAKYGFVFLIVLTIIEILIVGLLFKLFKNRK